jgi:hypothetical protein
MQQSPSTGPFGPYLTHQAYQQGYIEAMQPSNSLKTYDDITRRQGYGEGYEDVQGDQIPMSSPLLSFSGRRGKRRMDEKSSDRADEDDDDDGGGGETWEGDEKPTFNSRMHGSHHSEPNDTEGGGSTNKDNLSTPMRRQKSTTSQQSNNGADSGRAGGGGGAGGAGGGNMGEGSGGGASGGQVKRKKPRIALSCAQCTKVSFGWLNVCVILPYMDVLDSVPTLIKGSQKLIQSFSIRLNQ